MRLLHFRRTYVEKMFAIHAKIEAFKQTGKEIGTYARHYYELFCLAERPEVLAMLQSDEYAPIFLPKWVRFGSRLSSTGILTIYVPA